MATSGKPVRGKTSGKKNQKWNERISSTTSVVNLIFITLSTIVVAAGIGAAIDHFFFPIHQPPAKLTAEIKKATVQQNVTWADYLLGTGHTGNVPSPPSSDTPGILVQIQAQLSGYEHHLYSGDITLLNPKTQATITDLTFRPNANVCTEAEPTAEQYSFVLQCWIGEPVAHQSFLVRTRLYYTGLTAGNGPPGYVPVNAQFLAVLDTGVYTSTGG